MITDLEIVKGCCKGDYKCQELLYKRYSSKMLGVCLRYFNNKAEAEDCLQEGFIKVFNNLHTFKFEGSLEGWIRRIFVNTAINIYRANINDSNHKDIDEIKEKVRDENLIDNYFEADELLKLIQSLPDGYRQIFNLYAIEGYSHKEIADILNISENTSKSQLSRARKVLQEKLERINLNKIILKSYN